MATTTTMARPRLMSMDEAAFGKLQAWLSPAYPVGGFTFSHGLETAIADGAVRDAATLTSWVADVLEHGAGRTDAVLLGCAWRAERDDDAEALAEAAELAEALVPSAERLLETTAVGAAFAEVTAAAWAPGPYPAAYPVAFGQAAARHGIPLEPAARHYLQAFAAGLVSAGVRLAVAGQTDGQRAVAALLPLCAAVAAEATAATIEDVGGCAVRADIASMRHETLKTRLFRS
jgi:urease accessory protein